MRYSIQMKMINIALLFTAVLSVLPMDLPKTPSKKKGDYNRINNYEEGNMIVDFFRKGVPDSENPFVKAAQENDAAGIISAAKNLPKDKNQKKNIIAQALYCAVKNDYQNIFNILCTNTKTKRLAVKCFQENIVSFIQLAIFSNSWGCMDELVKTYLGIKAFGEEISQAVALKEQPDIFAALSNKEFGVTQKKDLFNIIENSHANIMRFLKNKENDLKYYINFLKKSFDKKQVQELDSIDPFLSEDDPCKKASPRYKKGSPGGNEKCIIS